MDNEMYDTPYTFRKLTTAEHEGFLIRTNIDTSHCTQPEEATNHLSGYGLRSCVVRDTNTDSSTQPETPEPDINNSTNVQNNPLSEENTNSDTEAQSLNSGSNDDSAANKGGGGQITWSLLTLLALIFLFPKVMPLRLPTARHST